MIAFFKLTLFIPLYNALAFLSTIVPRNDIGLAIVFLTLVVKIALSPLQHKASKTQSKMKVIEPELVKIKQNEDKEEQAKQIMELYKHHGINPFTSILLLFIQIPIIISLFYVFKSGFQLNLDILYPFVPKPTNINTLFLGLLDIHQKSYILAILVGLTQFVQMKLAIPPLPKDSGKEKSLSGDFARSMNLQMRYVMPAMIVFIAASLPSAISIYWITSNLFAVVHELMVRKISLKTALVSSKS